MFDNNENVKKIRKMKEMRGGLIGLYSEITPPPNKIMTFTLSNFVGGLNNRSDQLEDNEALNLLNMEFADDTLMEKKKRSRSIMIR